jgi:hypothetical protein
MKINGKQDVKLFERKNIMERKTGKDLFPASPVK